MEANQKHLFAFWFPFSVEFPSDKQVLGNKKIQNLIQFPPLSKTVIWICDVCTKVEKKFVFFFLFVVKKNPIQIIWVFYFENISTSLTLELNTGTELFLFFSQGSSWALLYSCLHELGIECKLIFLKNRYSITESSTKQKEKERKCLSPLEKNSTGQPLHGKALASPSLLASTLGTMIATFLSIYC